VREDAALDAAILFATKSPKLEDRRKIDDNRYELERKTTARRPKEIYDVMALSTGTVRVDESYERPSTTRR